MFRSSAPSRVDLGAGIRIGSPLVHRCAPNSGILNPVNHLNRRFTNQEAPPLVPLRPPRSGGQKQKNGLIAQDCLVLLGQKSYPA